MESPKQLIAVPVTLNSLSAAIDDRLSSLSINTPASEIMALIRLFDRVDAALDRLALAADRVTA